jgi:hydroxymethylbilane synthase
MCPAVGQGALAIETPLAHRELVAALEHAPTRAEVSAERALLAALGGGCQVPIGAHARVAGERLRMLAVVAVPDGSEIVRGEREGAVSDAVRIGRDLGAELLERGARRILAAVYTA